MAVRLLELSVVRQIREIRDKNRKGILEVVGPWGSAKTILALQTAKSVGQSLLMVTSSRIESENVYEDLCTFAGEEKCVLFPAWEVRPEDAMAPADDIVAERMNALKRLAALGNDGNALYVVIPCRALLQHVVKRDRLISKTIVLEAGKEYDVEDLLESLIEMGYKRGLMVEQRGEMSLRGGIFDVFPISSELPYRFEFFGDEIESIRRFEPESQRSVGTVDRVEILPRSEKEMVLGSGNLCAITDYLSRGTIVVLDEPVAIAEETEHVERQLGDTPYGMKWAEIASKLEKFPRISIAQVAYDNTAGHKRIMAPMLSINGWIGNTGGFWEQLKEWDIEDYQVVLLCNNTGERKRMLELLEEQGYRPGEGRFKLLVDVGRIGAGFVSKDDRLAVLSEREIFGKHYVRRVRRRFEAGSAITTFSDLKGGDYVVHVNHGVGRYLGLKRFSGKAGDFLKIQYAGKDVLYVPVTHIDLVQKYIGGEGSVPKIDRLGGATWAKTKGRVKKAVRDMTEELVKLYAIRESEDGYAFSADTPWQYEFEDAFEYEETPDQARAIVEVKQDMESRKPMDRLLCGDVGYGKTEVALRAAFKAVMDNMQVAILVPTTILAQQHYTTFSERLADYPITVEVLNRFRPTTQQKKTIERLKSGEVDIVIGTHRLISKDIQFKNLGLIVIDEEQRFGVAQKEKLKQLRTHVDVLTMTATPIPRTLHISLIGVRDMSIINTAPNDRLPVHTCIETFDENLIKEAIEREIAREGQTFLLHNRVQTIGTIARLVRKLVPRVRLGVAHGQMPEKELEEVMVAFIEKKLDVLVCTSIIGSGLDIPNANTIIMDRADRFGLSDLYQLRGRVGRYKHRAFAYLLIPGDRVPTEDAQKRLKALEEFSALGAGFRIAMRDLEIRGCGNLLGGAQHGHIAAVGYETYTQLIQEAVAELKEQPLKRRTLPSFEIAADAYIPKEYVPSEAQKITLYKRISSILYYEEAQEILDELEDRFGKPPEPVRKLVEVMKVRALGADAAVERITASQTELSVKMETSRLAKKKTRNALKEEFGGRIELAWDEKVCVNFRIAENEEPLAVAQKLLKFLSEL